MPALSAAADIAALRAAFAAKHGRHQLPSGVAVILGDFAVAEGLRYTDLPWADDVSNHEGWIAEWTSIVDSAFAAKEETASAFHREKTVLWLMAKGRPDGVVARGATTLSSQRMLTAADKFGVEIPAEMLQDFELATESGEAGAAEEEYRDPRVITILYTGALDEADVQWVIEQRGGKVGNVTVPMLRLPSLLSRGCRQR